jgi:6-phosphogluconate dehydrogenase (decarboxylating)
MPPWRHHRGQGQFRERRACRSGYRDGWRQHILQGRHQARERPSIKEHLLFRCRTSGGVWGLERGYCMMIGGTKDAVDRLDPIFRTLARGFGDIAHTPGGEGRDPSAEYGYIHAGPADAGYFVKMIHNGIEYGLTQACAEGFGILRGKADTRLPESERFTLDVADIA